MVIMSLQLSRDIRLFSSVFGQKLDLTKYSKTRFQKARTRPTEPKHGGLPRGDGERHRRDRLSRHRGVGPTGRAGPAGNDQVWAFQIRQGVRRRSAWRRRPKRKGEKYQTTCHDRHQLRRDRRGGPQRRCPRGKSARIIAFALTFQPPTAEAPHGPDSAEAAATKGKPNSTMFHLF